MGGAPGPPEASAAKPSAVFIARAAVSTKGVVRVWRARLPAARIGRRSVSVASLTNSIPGRVWSGSHGSEGSGSGFAGSGSRRIVPTSIAETPSTSAWWVFER